jgi:hypothetical protein
VSTKAVYNCWESALIGAKRMWHHALTLLLTAGSTSQQNGTLTFAHPSCQKTAANLTLQDHGLRLTWGWGVSCSGLSRRPQAAAAACQ